MSPATTRILIIVEIAHEEEMFEDDPLEFIRQDLDVTTGGCFIRGE